MADKAHKWTDKKLSKMEYRLFNIYKQAESEIRAEWDKYMDGLNKRLKSKNEALKEAIKSGDQAAIKAAREDLKNSIRWGTIMNQKYQDMVNVTVEKFTHINEIALAYINGEIPSVYVQNYNAVGQGIQSIVKGYNFTLVNEETVRQLTVLNTTLMLPPRKINVPKDKRWNKKQLNSAVLQGILQGEDIPTISKRIQKVTNSNYKSSVRTARTMVTAAENRGRLASQERAEENGIVSQKIWLATADARTRDSHLHMDKEKRNPNQPFSNGLMYPSDHAGRPEEVYNCRCRMDTFVVGFRKDNGDIEYINRPLEPESLHDKQIRAEKERRAEIKARKAE